MLSMSVIKTSGATANYFAADNYYAKDSQEALARSGWTGRGAEMLGLNGPIDKDQFKLLLDGVLPSGEQLGRVSNDGAVTHRPGWDLTFSAPKSVSLLALVGGDQRLEDAHRAAVEKALSFLEGNAVRTRAGSAENGGIRQEVADTLIIGLFHHDSSRELDPQLHTHSVVMNATLREDGKWRAIESREIYKAKMLAGAIYRAELADRAVAMGYQIERTHSDGRFEIAGFSIETLRDFSQRRIEIEASLAERGLSDAKASEKAALMTRAKKSDVDREALREEWNARVQKLELNLPAMIEKANPRFVWREDATLAARQAVAFASAKLAEREAVFSHDNLVHAALGHAVGKVTISDIQAAVKEAEEGRNIIPAAGMSQDDQGRHWTTQDAFRLESSAIALMKTDRSTLSPVMSKYDVDKQLANRSLTQGQREAAALILMTHDRVVGVQGYAGTGKTHMLDTVRELAAQNGFEVLGFTPTAAAANELQHSAHIPSTTLASHVMELRKALSVGKDGAVPDYSRQMWVVDEASMIATRQMHDLLHAAQQTGARVVLVGDVKQLGAVEAGKPFTLLQNADMAMKTMDEIMRQKDTRLLGAVKDSIDGQAKAALEKIKDSVYQIDDKQGRLRAISDHYLSFSVAQRDAALVLAPANEDRVTLNNMIREGLKKEGVLSGSGVKATVLVREGLTKVEMGSSQYYKPGDVVRFGRSYRQADFSITKGEYVEVINTSKGGSVELKTSGGQTLHWQPHKVAGKSGNVEVYRKDTREVQEGDIIRWTRNDKERGLRNSELAKIESADGYMVTVKLSNGEKRQLDLRQRTDTHWEHAYASTVHAAQGKTVDVVLVHAEDWRRNLTNQKSFYVELSRARYKAHIYTNDKDKLIKAIEERAGEKSSAAEGVKAFGNKYKEMTKIDASEKDRQQRGADNNPLRNLLDSDGLLKAVSAARLNESNRQREEGVRRVIESEHQI